MGTYNLYFKRNKIASDILSYQFFTGTPLRLIGGFAEAYRQNGRLEVFYNNIWGTVCYDSFTITSANLICRLLGFRYEVPLLNIARTSV